VGRLQLFASAQGWPVAEVVREIGSGLNGRRRKLLHLLADRSVGAILVEHRDRLARFGFEFIEAALSAKGRRVAVADETEEMEDIWQDFIELVTSMCAWIYGKHSARNRAKRALRAVRSGEDQG
jgi:putative resolvase